MTTFPLSAPQAWRRRFSSFWRGMFAPGDPITLVVAIALLLMPAMALLATGWEIETRTILFTSVSSVLFGFVLARSQYNELAALLMNTVYGACFILIFAAIGLEDEGGIAQGIFEVFARALQWGYDALNGGINQDDLVFTVLVSGLFWSLGYNLAWHLFRVDRLWRAVLPPALILLTNTIYYTGTADIERYVIAYSFFALLLLIRSNLEARSWEWYLKGVRVPRKLRRQVFWVGLILAVVVLIAAWLVPRQTVDSRLSRFQEFLQSEPLMELSELWNRLFTSAETQGPTTADYYGGDSLQLGGAIRLGDEIVFNVNTANDRRYYWRSRTFDFYSQGSWESGADTRLTDPEPPLDIIQEVGTDGARVSVTQTFTMGLSASRLIYAAPQVAQIDLAARTDLRYSPDGGMILNVIRPIRVLYEGDSYRAISLMSNAGAAQLRAAGTEYPTWVRDTYSTYVPSVTGRTVGLAAQIIGASGTTNPYDQAKAVETWLRSNITYNETIPTPPQGQDPIDWVLFDLREGYCNYYASAMVVMLRSQGIPARMAAGFAQGSWNTAENAFTVRERDAHTWVEVYFPGYGWIEFEPTSAQQPVDRGDEEQAPPPAFTPLDTPTPLPTVPPTATPLPSPTFTPTISPPEGAEATPDADGSAPVPPTVTPTFTPSPTATPVIVPDAPPPLRPQSPDIFSLVAPAIAALLVGVLAVSLIVAIALFVYWWWEWRGMRGLHPVVRAWARLERYTGLIGVRAQPQQTPEERRQNIVRTLPPIAPPVNAIAALYTQERYSPPMGRSQIDGRDDSANRAWSDARSAIVRRRLRRIFMPWKR